MNRVKNAIANGLALLSLSVIAACSGLTSSDKPAATTWWLEPWTGGSHADTQAARVPVDLAVTVVPGLDTIWILALTQDAELKPYTAARWADNPPDLLASLIGRSLQASGSFSVVAGRGGRDGCNLILNVSEFFAVIGPSGLTSEVRVAMDGRHSCHPDDPVAVSLQASAPVREDRMATIVAAFQRALDQAMADLLEQLP